MDWGVESVSSVLFSNLVFQEIIISELAPGQSMDEPGSYRIRRRDDCTLTFGINTCSTMLSM
jgi:hypothetical protein